MACSLRNQTVLIVDDDEATGRLIQFALEEVGLQAQRALTAREVLRLVEHVEPPSIRTRCLATRCNWLRRPTGPDIAMSGQQRS